MPKIKEMGKWFWFFRNYILSNILRSIARWWNIFNFLQKLFSSILDKFAFIFFGKSKKIFKIFKSGPDSTKEISASTKTTLKPTYSQYIKFARINKIFSNLIFTIGPWWILQTWSSFATLDNCWYFFLGLSWKLDVYREGHSLWWY